MTFEYDVVKIPVQAFQHLAFFCSQNGECALDDVPMDQAGRLRDI